MDSSTQSAGTVRIYIPSSDAAELLGTSDDELAVLFATGDIRHKALDGVDQVDVASLLDYVRRNPDR